MKFCKRCLQMDTRYGLSLDSNGICGGCNYYESMNYINWDERKKQLYDIIEEAKIKAKKSNAQYDCVIGVSGGKDSTFIACYIKENFDVNILLVNCPPQNITDEGLYNINNLCSHGFDIVQYRFNPDVAQRLARYSFEKYGHICMPYEHAMASSVVRTALNYNIPLIIMGENPALVWGTKHGKADDDWFNSLKNNTNTGIFDKSTWKINNIAETQLAPYTFPDFSEIKNKNIRAIYLQYYVREYSPVYNADFSVARGMKGRYRDTIEELGRYRIFSSIDDDLMIPNEMLKYYKNGFGRAFDDAVIDLREGRLSRKEAIRLIQKYDGLCGHKFIVRCCKYLNITEEYFWSIVEKWINKNLFEKNSNGQWVPKFTIGKDTYE